MCDDYDIDARCVCGSLDCTRGCSVVTPPGQEVPKKACPNRVDHPAHYQTADGLECIDVIEALGWGPGFCLGNALKYLWRAGRKEDTREDLEKARWHLSRALTKHPQP